MYFWKYVCMCIQKRTEEIHKNGMSNKNQAKIFVATLFCVYRNILCSYVYIT